MGGYVGNLEKLTKNNTYFRRVVFTGTHMQLVVMTLQPGEDIGMEVHPSHDQFCRIESGEGKVVMNGEEYAIREGDACVVPAGCQHNVINTSFSTVLTLYTIYAPAHHPEGTIHETKADAAV